MLTEVENKSTHVPPKSHEPLWRTEFDPESGSEYWVDIESGKICMQRPPNGTFVSEIPLRSFRENNSSKRRISSRMSLKSIPSFTNMLGSHQNVQENQREFLRDDEILFEDLSMGGVPTQYDAGTMFGVGNDGN